MKILKGFEALEYALKNKDKNLYNKRGEELFYNFKKDRLCIIGGNKPFYGENDHIIINDKTISSEWYTENKKKVLIKIYINNKLSNIETHYIFDVRDNLMKLIAGIEGKYSKLYNNRNDCLVTVRYEMFR